MGLFEDVSRFLEQRLDEFLRNNPHLELQALEEQLQQQEGDAIVLLADLQRQEKRLQDDIITTAKEVKLWHERIEKAKRANRQDLVQPALEREAALLRQGNQLWGQMSGVKERIKQVQVLIQQLKERRKEVRAQVLAAQATRQAPPQNSTTQTSRAEQTGWSQGTTPRPTAADPLDDQFRRWEMDEELEQLKRQMGR